MRLRGVVAPDHENELNRVVETVEA